MPSLHLLFFSGTPSPVAPPLELPQLIHTNLRRLLFVALLVLSILTLCGVLNSDWVGYRSMRGARTEKSAPAAAPEVPMSTDPVTSPSELSSRDAEVLHNQPNNQPLSPSSPSAVASELSGDNVHEKQAGHA